MPAKMAQISPLGRRSGCQDLRPPSAPPGGFVKTRQQRKNPPRFGVHLGNPGLIEGPEYFRAATVIGEGAPLIRRRGGLPIIRAGQVEGALGVSGGHSNEEDEECALAGIGALEKSNP